MDTLPLDAEPLSEPGFFVWTSEPNQYGFSFILLQEGPYRYLHRQVCEIRYAQSRGWGPPRPEDLEHKLRPAPGDGYDHPSTRVRATAEILNLSAAFLDALNEGAAEEIKAAKAKAEEECKRYEEERERRQREYEEERQRRQAELEALRELQRKREGYIFEMLKWQLGEKMKLTRDGKRATVFGTIDHVDERGMNITTEKGKFMHIRFRDINKLWMKDGDNRRYTVLYTTGDETKEVSA